MSTTTLFVEILIIGFEALAWLGLFIIVLWEPNFLVEIIKKNSNYSTLFTILLVALAYVLGIIIDRVADSFYKIFRYSHDESPPVKFGEMRLRVLHESEGMAKFIDYQRSRLRIARATFLNMVILVFAIVIWLIHSKITSVLFISIVIGIGIMAIIFLLTTTRRIDKAQTVSLIQAYEIIAGDKKNNSISQKIVAAVCYRRRDNEIEFLLVRTKGGKYWTFPKGHVEIKEKPPEQPWHAAKREAREEAGVEGSIEKEPLTHYTYYKGKKEQENIVAAFLMRVEAEFEPEETFRDPTWFTPEEAMKKLSTHRRTKFIKENQRVIKNALNRLKKYQDSKGPH